MRTCVFVCLFASACANTAAPTTATTTTTRLQSPLQVRWEQLELTATHARLIAHIARIAPFPAPLNVRIEIPNGARLRVGRATFDVSPNTASDELLEPIELAYDQLPAQDLVLKVFGVSHGTGVNYEVPYRFGRRDPVTADPVKATGPSVQVHGKSLGPSVPVAPEKR